MPAKQIVITYGGKQYTLAYNRRSVEIMEKQGFQISEMRDKPVSTLPALFSGAFLANHPTVKKDLTDEIFEHMNNKQELIGKLAELYNEPILTLIGEPEENEGNANWEAGW